MQGRQGDRSLKRTNKHSDCQRTGTSGCSKRKRLKGGRCSRTIALDHEGFDDIVANQFKVGVADPVRDARFGAGEEVVEDGDLVAEEHESVDEMRADKACAARDEDALPAGLRKKLDGGETAEGGVGDGLRLGVIDRL
jgi:hypothetical protein